ncbi:hypothetical protein L915_07117 [Phytophthora nicotianae]|uniref:Uncharacterized protein n=1 Tax=Phytophthora nicotianae TaxID=4792 RepID=W2J6K5_PHYNI|nr:hypothetical protein L915_07117 [Phytophthora nicotianae]ETL42054.1 hypothetical protein L916_07071 [Phytophthora nicotianae]
MEDKFLGAGDNKPVHAFVFVSALSSATQQELHQVSFE